ncbi:Head domain of trimeric autotransporter adhesin, partial [Alysiella filiformis DSM 16848]
VSANGANGSVVNAGEVVDLNNTDGNIVISKASDNNNVSFNLADTVKIGGNSNASNPITINSTTGKIDGLVGNLPDTFNNDVYNTAKAPVTTNASLPDNLNVKNAATVGDILNSGWNVQGNGAAKDFVKAYDTVNFVNGTGTTAVVETDKDGKVTNVTFNVNSQALNNNSQQPVVYTLQDGTRVYPSPKGDGTFTKEPNGEGDVIDPRATDAPKIIASMNSAGNNTTAPTVLANVNGNLAPTYNAGDNIIGTDGKPTDTAAVPANVSKSAEAPAPKDVKAMYNNAATVGDVLNAGWNIQGNGEAKDFVKPYDTVNFVNGTGTTAVVTTDEEGKATSVTFNSALAYVDGNGNTTTADGKPNAPTNTVSLVGGNTSAPVTIIGATSGLTPTPVTTMPLGNTGAPVNNSLINFNNLPTPVADNTVATVGDLRNLGWVVSAKGNNYSDAVKSSNEVEFVGENGVSVTGMTKDGKRIITIQGVTQAMSVNTTGQAQLGNVTGANVSGSPAGNTTAPSTAPSNAGTTLATAQDVVNTINNVSWNSTTAVAPNSTGVANTTGDTSVKAGDTMTFTAGNNMNLTQDGKNLTIATKDNVTFNTMNATNVNVAPQGNLTVGGNATVDVGGNKILNVANGNLSANSTDAVNGSQLYQIYQVVGGNNQNVTTTNGTLVPVQNGTTPNGTNNATVPNGTSTINTALVIPASPNSNITVINGNVSNTPVSNNYTMTTYNVEGQKNYITNNVLEAIGRMNEQGIQFFHTNDGTGKLRAIQGENDTDSSASGKWATAIGSRSEAAGAQAIAMGREAKALGQDSIAIGTGNVVTGKGSGAIGDPSLVTGDASYSFGNNNTLAFDDTFAIGNNIKQTQANSIFLGNATGYSYATGTDENLVKAADEQVYALAKAADTESTLKNTYELAAKAVTDLNNATAEKKAEAQAKADALKADWEKAQKALGDAQTNATTALEALKANEAIAAQNSINTSTGRTAGISANLTSQNVVGLTEANKFAGGDQVKGVVSVGSDTETRRIQNVAPGLLSEQSTDAINGSQLYAVAGNLNNKIDYNAARTVTVDKVAPNMKVDENVTGPITGNTILFSDGTGSSVVKGSANGTVVVKVNTPMAYMEGNKNNFNVTTGTYDGNVSAPSNTVRMVGASTQVAGQYVEAPVSISNVDSAVRDVAAEAGLDVNKLTPSQRHGLIMKHGNQDGVRNNVVNAGDLHAVGSTLTQQINDVDNLASAGVAAAMATAGLPQVYLPGKSMVAVAGSTYRGKQGYAVGFSAITDGGNWIVKGSVSGHSKGKFGATVGAGYQW